MKKIFLLLLFSVPVYFAKAQEATTFQPAGEPILRIFSNFHSGLTEADNNSVFEIERAYLGYSYKVSPNFSASILLDIGSPEDESVYAMVKRYAYFKNAYIKYAKGDWDVSFGIIGMNHFKVQEKFWGYRYIQKSFADEYKFGKSADLGILANYRINDRIQVDAAIVNGEGYSQLQDDSKFEYTLGTTLQIPEKLTWRLFVNYGPSESETKMVYAAFLGYQPIEKVLLAAEYNLLQNYKYVDGKNQTGFSFYSTYKVKNTWKIFGRYDILNSNILEGTSSPWNLSSDGTAIIAGIEKKINEFLKASVNYKDWYPKAANLDNEAYIYFNVEFKL